MPAVEQIEFEGDLVSNTHGCAVVSVDTWTADTGVKIPRIRGTIQSENRSNIVIEDNVDVQSTSHPCVKKIASTGVQSASLEKVIIAFHNSVVVCLFHCRGDLVFCRVGHGRFHHGFNGIHVGLRESTTFVDCRHFSDNVIVESIETDEECADTGGKPEDTSFRETIRFQETVFECTNRVLVILSGAIEWSKVEVGRGLVDVIVRLRGFEEV